MTYSPMCLPGLVIIIHSLTIAKTIHRIIIILIITIIIIIASPIVCLHYH